MNDRRLVSASRASDRESVLAHLYESEVKVFQSFTRNETWHLILQLSRIEVENRSEPAFYSRSIVDIMQDSLRD